MLPFWFWPAICAWLIACGVAVAVFGATSCRAQARRARTSTTTGGNR